MRAVVGNGDVMAARDLLVETLEAAHYPVRDVSVEERGAADSERVANTSDTAEIEAAIQKLETSDLIQAASWTWGTSD